MSISYTVKPNYFADAEIQLSAKTDTGARRQAKSEAKAAGWNDYVITFYRSSDGQHGTIDA